MGPGPGVRPVPSSPRASWSHPSSPPDPRSVTSSGRTPTSPSRGSRSSTSCPPRRLARATLAAPAPPAGSRVGEVVGAAADFAIGGIEILHVLPPKAARKEPEMLTVVGTRQDEPLVTTTLVEKKGRSRDRDGDRRGP